MSRQARDAFPLLIVVGAKIRFIRVKAGIIRIGILAGSSPLLSKQLLPFQFKVFRLHKSARQLRFLIAPVQVQVVRILPGFIRIRDPGIPRQDRLIQVRGKPGLGLPLGFLHRFLRGSLRLETSRVLLSLCPCHLLGLTF